MKKEAQNRQKDRYSAKASRTKLLTKIKTLAFGTLGTLISSYFLLIPTAVALPQGGVVSAGQATISSPTANSLLINQGTDKTVIDWNSFNIGQPEQTTFAQPSQSSIILNRINPGNGASQIYGSLKANGQVWLVNPAGVYFGSTARVDVGGLLATTANISNQDFMSGNYNFVQSPEYNGSVINEGTITVADKGMAALVAPGVANRGVIVANMGKVTLASGNEYTVDFYGDNLINFGVNSKVTQTPVDQNGQPLKDAVSNSGTIIAKGGRIMMTASVAEKIVDNSINMSGKIIASAASQEGGTVILMGGDEGKVRVSGTINVAGKNAGQVGGKVIITGKRVALVKNAKINASGYAGGGEVLIGGNLQGSGPLPNADTVYIGKSVKINADAKQNGNGGKVVVWSNDITKFYGKISAQGGIESGNGGFVETSGHNYLDINGSSVSTYAQSGNFGTWLLDPANVTIQNNGGVNSNEVLIGSTYFPTSGSSTSILDFSLVNALLASNNIIITTTNNGSSGGSVGNITVIPSGTTSSTQFNWSGFGNLTLNAANNITLSNASGTQAVNSTGSGSLILTAGNALFIESGISLSGGSLTINGALAAASPINLGNGSGSTTTIFGPAIIFPANKPVTLTGNTSLDAQGYQAITFNSTVNGAYSLTLYGQNSLGTVGGTTPLSSLTTTAGGTTTFNGNVTTTGNQTYNDQQILNTDVILSSTAGGSINFSSIAGSIDGAHSLQLSTSGSKSINATIGNTTPLTSFTIGAGTGTTFNGSGSLVKTTGQQTYNDAITFSANSLTFQTTGSNADIVFGSSVTDGGTSKSLTVTTGSGGKTTLNGNVTAGNGLTFNGPVLIGANLSMNTNGGALNLNSTVNDTVSATHTLTTNMSFGTLTLGADIGGLTPLGGFTVSGSANLSIPHNITATNITLNATNGQIITSAGTLLLTPVSETGVITLNAPTYSLNTGATSQIGGTSLGNGTNSSIVLTATNSTSSIDLVSSGGGFQPLVITKAQLNIMRAKNLRIGDSSLSPNINIVGALNLPVDASFLGTSAVTLASSGTISQSAALTLGGSTGLLIREGGSNSALLTNTGNGFSTVAGTAPLGSISMTNISGSTLTVGSVTDDLGTVNGITGANGVTLTTSGTGDIIFSQNVTSSANAITATAGRNITINNGNLTASSNINLTATTGNISESGTGILSTSGGSLFTSSATGTTLNNANTVAGFIGQNTSSGNLQLTNNVPLTIISGGTGLTNVSNGSIVINNTGALTINHAISSTAGPITLTSSGLLTINKSITTSNNNISLAGVGITMNADNAANTQIKAGGASSGNVTLNSQTGALTLNSSASFSNYILAGNSNGTLGKITLTQDTIALTGAIAPQIGGSDVNTGYSLNTIIRPSTSTQTIGIAGGAGALSITSALLSDIRSTDLRIGAATGTGDITLAAITMPANVLHNNGSAGYLTLVTGGNITQTGALNLSTNSAALIIRNGSTSNGAVTLTQNNVLTNVAVSEGVGTGLVQINNAANTSLTVATGVDDIGTVTGITAPGGISLSTTGTGAINVNHQVNTSGNNGNISFTSFGAGAITQANSVTVNAGSGTISYASSAGAINFGTSNLLETTGNLLIAGSGIVLPSDANSQLGGTGLGTGTAANTILTAFGTTSTMCIGTAGCASTNNFTPTQLNTIHSTNVRLGGVYTFGSASLSALSASGPTSITIGSATPVTWQPVATFATGTLSMVTSGSTGTISETANSSIDLSVSGGGLLFESFKSVSLNASGSANKINRIAADANGQGSLQITNAVNNSLTISSLQDDSAFAVNGINIPNGDFTAGVGVSLTTSGNASIAINAPISITTNGTDIALTSGTGGISALSSANVNAGNAPITLNAGGGPVNLNSSTLTTTNATANAVSILNASTVALGNITATSGTVVLGTGNISGAVTQNASTAILTNNLIANTTNSITLTNSNNDFTGTVTLANTGANDISIKDVNALTLGTVSAGRDFSPISTGALSFGGTTVGRNLIAASNGGAITQTGAISASSLVAKTLNNSGSAVTLNNAGNNIANIDLRSRNTSDAATSSGDITFRNSAGYTVTGLETSGNVILIGGGTINVNTPISLNNASIDAGNNAINFSNTVNANSLSLQNSTSSNGTVTFNDNVVLNNLTTYAQPYKVIFNGSNNIITNNTTLNNTGGVTFNGSTQFTNGLTSTASTTTINGNLNTVASPMTLASVILTGNSSLATAGGDLIMNAITGDTNTLSLNSGSLGNITMNGNSSLGALSIINTNDFTNNGQINSSSYLQSAGNVTNIGTLIVSNNANITTKTLLGNLVVGSNLTVTGTTFNGTINVGSLNLIVTNADLTGFVGGSSGQAGAAKINWTDPNVYNTLYFDGIVLNPAPSPIKPITPVTPTVVVPSQARDAIVTVATSPLRNSTSLLFPYMANNQIMISTAETATAINLINTASNLTQGITVATNASVARTAVVKIRAPASYALLPGNGTIPFFRPLASVPAVPLSEGALRALGAVRAGLVGIPELASGLGALLLAFGAIFATFMRSTKRYFTFTRVIASAESIGETSFELRTMLHNITGFAELMMFEKQGSLTDIQKEYLNNILISSALMNQTLTNELERSSHLTTESFAIISFKLRTALVGVVGFAKLLSEEKVGNLSSENKEYLDYILVSSNKLLSTVETLKGNLRISP